MKVTSTNPGANAAAVEDTLKAIAIVTGTTSKDGRAIQLVYAGEH